MGNRRTQTTDAKAKPQVETENGAAETAWVKFASSVLQLVRAIVRLVESCTDPQD